MTIDEAVAIVECLQAFEDVEQEALDTVLSALTAESEKVARCRTALLRIKGLQSWSEVNRAGMCVGIASDALDDLDALKNGQRNSGEEG